MAKNKPKDIEDLLNEIKKNIDGLFESTKKTLEDIKIVSEEYPGLREACKIFATYRIYSYNCIYSYILDKVDKLANSLGHKPKK